MMTPAKRKVIKNREPSGPRKQRKASPSCCCVDFDGDDVLMEILVRLPVKSLIRFQLVCKLWLSLISGDQFRRLHTLRRHKPPPSLILVKFNPKVTLFYFNPIIRRGERLLSLIPFSIVDNSIMLSSSNGLMLLHCLDDNGYYLYNPITKESKKLSLTYNIFQSVWLRLLFDPSKSLHYEIVCVREAEKEGPRLQIEVFNSEIGIWRVCEELIAMPRPGTMRLTTSCVRYKRFIYLTYYFGRIICIDTVKNMWHIVDCPVSDDDKVDYSHSLQESNGRLYYCTLLRSAAALWEVQVDEDDPRQSEWLLKYDHIFPECWIWDMLTFIAETSTMLIHKPGKIMAYNFRDQSYKELLHLDPHLFSVNVHQFGGTLAPL
ncbi:hypothetical protein ACS0TY_000371 [Phlomoides rotata]